MLKQDEGDYSSKNMVCRISYGQSRLRMPIKSRSQLHSHYINSDLLFAMATHLKMTLITLSGIEMMRFVIASKNSLHANLSVVVSLRVVVTLK